MEKMNSILEEIEYNTSILMEIQKVLSEGFDKIGKHRV